MRKQPGAELLETSVTGDLDPTQVPPSRPDAASLLRLWAAVMLVLPAKLVLAPLGSAGSPAQILGMAGAFWWAASHFLSRLPRTRDLRVVQNAMALFVFACLVSYIVAVTRPREHRAQCC